MEGSWFRLLSTVENPLGFHVWSRNIRLLPVKKWWQKGLNKDHEKPAQWILWLSLRTESREQVRKLSTWIWITKKGFSKKNGMFSHGFFPYPPWSISIQMEFPHSTLPWSSHLWSCAACAVRFASVSGTWKRYACDAFCVMEHPGVQGCSHEETCCKASISREMSMKFRIFDECLMTPEGWNHHPKSCWQWNILETTSNAVTSGDLATLGLEQQDDWAATGPVSN